MRKRDSRPRSSSCGADGRDMRMIVANAAGPLELAWSPDSRRLAASMKLRDEGAGLWIIDATTGRHDLILSDPLDTLGALAWHADGRSIFVAVGVGIPSGAREKEQRAQQVGLYAVDVP